MSAREVLPSGIGFGRARHHLFLCIGPDCCDPAAGVAAWEHLKARCRDLAIPVLRTKAACFRICSGGPWLLIYPEGAWYGGITPERIDRIIDEHLGAGHPIAEWLAAVHPVPPPQAEPA